MTTDTTDQPTLPVPVSKQVTELTALSVSPEERQRLICKELLIGETQVRAERDAATTLPEMQSNTQVLTLFGIDTLEGVNRLNDRMLDERPPEDVPELRELMKNLSRNMRGISKRYDPTDPKVYEKYEEVRGGILARLGFVKTFIEEFRDDMRDIDEKFDRVTEKLLAKQNALRRNIGYFDQFYDLNELEIDKLIYVIAVMEFIRELAAKQAEDIVVGDSNLGDRGDERKAKLTELIGHLDNKIIAFKGRLWVAWAMAPQIRNMRAISVGLSNRIDQTVGITIPTMKNTVAMWLTLSEAQQAAMFYKAVDDTANQAITDFAGAAKAAVPAMASALATPALDPRAVVAWSESLSAQADGIIQAIEEGEEKRAELEDALITGKKVLDTATQRINEAQLKHVLEIAQQAPLEIATSVPSAQN